MLIHIPNPLKPKSGAMGCSTAPDPYFHCRISTITFLLLFEDAAFTTVRIAFAILPWRPMTLPISAVPTFSSIMTASSFSVSVTTTSSGFSTRDFAITSTYSFFTYLPDSSLSGRYRNTCLGIFLFFDSGIFEDSCNNFCWRSA